MCFDPSIVTVKQLPSVNQIVSFPVVLSKLVLLDNLTFFRWGGGDKGFKGGEAANNPRPSNNTIN